MSMYATERDGSSVDTLTERATLLIERDILDGRIAPGSKLNIQPLAEYYNIGTTPIREALSRLVARQIVVTVGQRGFRVAEISKADLEDITRVRTVIEVAALRLSIEFGDDAWEARVVAALHRLRRFVERNDTQISESGAEFNEIHKSFHTSIISGCGSPRMLQIHSSLYDQAYRYRRVMMVRHKGPRTFVHDHVTLADAALARQTEKACNLLSEHLNLTISYVYGDGQD